MPALQADADGQRFFACLFGRGQHAAHAGRVDGHRLFHEDVFAGLDGRLEMDRAKTGRRGQDHQVGTGVDRLLIGVEADELPLLGDVDPIGLFALEQL